MYCENKNHILDLYFLEGKESEHSEMSEHIEHCESCREYLGSLHETMNLLDKLKNEEPANHLFNKILSEVSVSIPKPAQKQKEVELVPILQIAFGEIFLFSLIYFIKIQITLLAVWDKVEKNWIVQSIGSVGVSVILVLIAGSFITLSLAPILVLESNRKKNFYY